MREVHDFGPGGDRAVCRGTYLGVWFLSQAAGQCGLNPLTYHRHTGTACLSVAMQYGSVWALCICLARSLMLVVLDDVMEELHR